MRDWKQEPSRSSEGAFLAAGEVYVGVLWGLG